MYAQFMLQTKELLLKIVYFTINFLLVSFAESRQQWDYPIFAPSYLIDALSVTLKAPILQVHW